MKNTAASIMEIAKQTETIDATNRLKRFQTACIKLDTTLTEMASHLSQGYTTIVSFPVEECLDQNDLNAIKAELHRAGFVVRQASTGYPDDDAYVKVGLS